MTLPITVVIPTYNRPAYLQEALESVRAQTQPPEAIVVVDDGSSPPVGAFAGVQVIAQAHRGMSAARNAGIGAARTPWVAFLDDDDVWDPRKLELQWQAVERYPSAGIVFTDWLIFGGAEVLYTSALFDCDGPVDHHLDEIRRAYAWLRREPDDRYVLCENDVFSHALVRYAPFVLPSSVLLRRELAEQAGGFDEAMPRSEVSDFFLRVAALGIAGVAVEQQLVRYRVHARNVSKDYVDAVQWTAYMVLKARDQVGAYPPQMQTFWRAELPPYIDSGARAAFVSGRFGDARRLYANLVAYRPSARARIGLLIASLLDTPLGTGAYRSARKLRQLVRVLARRRVGAG